MKKLIYKLLLVSTITLIPSVANSQSATQRATQRVPTCLVFPDSQSYVPCTGVVPVDSSTGDPLRWQDLFSGIQLNTSNLQVTTNTSLASIDTKLTNVATAANQSTTNTTLTSIDTRLSNTIKTDTVVQATAANRGAVVGTTAPVSLLYDNRGGFGGNEPGLLVLPKLN